MKKQYLIGYRLLFGLLGMSALVTEVVILIERGVFNFGNFASFFTVQSNILAVIALLGGALLAYSGKKSAKFDFFRGAVTFYMIVTGIVFAMLLAGLTGIQLTAVPWDNTVLHYIIPIVMAADWLIDAPEKRIKYHKAILWIIYPVAYLVYSLIRGPIVDWYPYPFLNPANGGYGEVLLTSLFIFIGGLILIYAVSLTHRHPRKKKKA